jgi:hypothetical protein
MYQLRSSSAARHSTGDSRSRVAFATKEAWEKNQVPLSDNAGKTYSAFMEESLAPAASSVVISDFPTSTHCAICGDKFETQHDSVKDELVYVDAIVHGGSVCHQNCAISERGGAVPDASVGMKRAMDIDLPIAKKIKV